MRRDLAPDLEMDAPHLPAAGGRRVGRLSLLLTVAAAAGLAAWLPRLDARQVQAVLTGGALVAVVASPPGRWVSRRVLPGRARRWAAGGGAGALLAGWGSDYFIPALVAVSAGVLWGASRRRSRPGAQRIEDVKPAVGGEPPIERRWPTAATRTGLVHPGGDAQGQPVELTGPATPNGVGGRVLTVALPPGLLPEHVAGRSHWLSAWLHVPYLYVRAPGDGVVDLAEIHYYLRRPLTEQPIAWQRLAGHARGGVARIPYALDVFGDALHLDGRKCILIVGETDAGKTCIQLAFIAGCTASGIPLRLHLADNRSDGDWEMRALADAAEGYARDAAEVWWQIRLLEVEIAIRRRAGLSADNATFTPTARWPLVHLAITELLTALGSRPPAEPLPGMDWSAYTGGRFERRPDVKDWRLMVAESLGAIAREGRSVGVAWSACSQAGQLDATETMRHVRRYVPQRIAMRLLAGSDVDPVLGDGARAAGANAHKLPPDVPGLLYALPDGLTPHLGRAAWVPPAEITDLAALLRAAEMDRLRSANRGGDPA